MVFGIMVRVVVRMVVRILVEWQQGEMNNFKLFEVLMFQNSYHLIDGLVNKQKFVIVNLLL